MKAVRRICSFIIGFVFLLAGLFKLADPVGSGFIVSSYYVFFHVGFLDFSARFFGVLLALCESLLGAALLAGVWKKLVATVSAAFLAFFTLLTLILLVFNPNMDCGCFGEAVHLTHAQSFLKNIVLDLLWAGAFIPYSSLTPARRMKTAGFCVAAVSILAFMVWSFLSIPPEDFTAFAPGREIVVDGDPSSDAVLSFYDADGEYRDSLAVDGKVIIISLPRPGKLSEGALRRVSDFVSLSGDCGFNVVVLSGDRQTDLLSASPSLEGRVFSADRRVLYTLNRSNGGAVYVSDGLIVKKWPSRFLPSCETLQALAAEDPVSTAISETTSRRMKFQAFLLYIFSVVILL